MLTNAILVVGNDQEHFNRILEMLLPFGFTEGSFCNCRSLADLTSLAVQAFSADFVLVDLEIVQESDPLDIYVRVQEQFPLAPIVVFNKKNDPYLDAAIIKAGAQSFLVKGEYHSTQLFSIINHAADRNNLKQELRRLKCDYQALFENNPLAMFVVDTKSNRFLAVNKAAVLQYGYSKEEFLSMQLCDIEENGKQSTASLYLDKEDKSGPSYHKHYKKNNEVVYVEITSTATAYDKQPSLIITVNDITEKIIAAEEEKSEPKT